MGGITHNPATRGGQVDAHLRSALDREIPLHFSRYYPRHRMQTAATPEATLHRIWERARERLPYVYLGNVAPGKHSNTYCGSCGALLIERSGYNTRIDKSLREGACAGCGTQAHIAA